MLSKDQLLKLRNQGLLVGQDETTPLFLERLKHLKTYPELTCMHFSVAWVPLKQSKRIPFWMGGFTSFIQKNGIHFPIIWMKKKKQDVLQHELVHAMRSTFSDDRYEEVMACLAGDNRFRKTYGALIESSAESIFWFACIVALLLAQILCAIYFPFFAYSFLFPLFMLMPIFFFSIRLWKKKRIVHRAFRCMQKIFQLEDPLHVLIQLTDQEIEFFAKATETQAKQYIEKQTSLRWQQILLAVNDT